ncbi:unnamed protein product, partial [Ectocarpus fasciculatus]
GGGGFLPGGADSVGRSSPLSDSPLVTGLSFPLELAGYSGGGGGGRVFGRTGSEGALSAHGSGPTAAVAAIFSGTRSEGKAGSDEGGQGTAGAGFPGSAAGEGAGRGFASGLFGLDTVGGGVGIGSSPSSHNSAGPVDAAPATMPQQLNLGRGFGGGGGGGAIGSGMDPPLRVDTNSLFSSFGQPGSDGGGGGGDVMPSGHRQSSGVSSTPVGGERGGAVGGGGGGVAPSAPSEAAATPVLASPLPATTTTARPTPQPVPTPTAQLA